MALICYKFTTEFSTLKLNIPYSGFPRVRKKSGKTGFLKKSGKSQEILRMVRKKSKFAQKSGKSQGKWSDSASQVMATFCPV